MTSGGFSVAPIIDDVSDDMLIVKRLVFGLCILDFVRDAGLFSQKRAWKPKRLIALRERGTRSC